MTDRLYYTYIHKRADNGEVFYAGCSKAKQRITWKWKRTKRWQEIVGEAGGFVAERIGEHGTIDDAHEAEILLIAKYGRECDGGTLCNITAGGKGTNGMKFSPELRAKLSASHKISNSVMKGDKLPDWWKQKISVSKVGDKNPMYGKISHLAKPVVNIENGVFYDSVQDAADCLGIKMQTLWARLSGKNPNRTLLRFA